MSSSTTSRKFRAFLKWMEANGILYSDGLHFAIGDCVVSNIGVKALCDFREGDLIATIPKQACLTVKTTGAADVIEDARLAGGLGLSVAIMYERSREEMSPWFEYLQLLPSQEALPITWDADKLESLRGTETYQVVQEDRRLIMEDWEECVLPLCEANPNDFPWKYFTLEQYFSAKTLVASRAFEVDDYHGCGMVPLADLFNHKTGAEDVHLTGVSSDSESDAEGAVSTEMKREDHGEADAGITAVHRNDDSGVLYGGTNTLEMILVNDVTSGSEIFNTYGSLSSAALLLRYGFTEPENPNDIVNIDYALVMKYLSLLFSNRYLRKRVRLWRCYGCTACTSQDTQYFELTPCGKPQLDLLFLLFIVHLSNDAFDALELDFETLDVSGRFTEANEWTDRVIATLNYPKLCRSYQGCQPKNLRKQERKAVAGRLMKETGDLYNVLLTEEVCEGLRWLYDRRDEVYGTSSLEDDLHLLDSINRTQQPELYYATCLRLSERRILRNAVHYLDGKKCV